MLETEGPEGHLHKALTSLVRLACEGKLHPNAAETLCAATLIPLKKKDDGIRPIAVGETIRRAIGKALLRTPQVREEVSTLGPRQTGVGVARAAELVGMGVQRLVDGLSPTGRWIAAQVDVSNAYNEMRREAVLRGALRKAPGAYNWLSFCYTEHVPLYCQGARICSSQIEVHEGDSMGPLGFALGLELVLEECHPQATPLLWNVWYLDDGTIVGDAGAVFAYLDALEGAPTKIGLWMNPQKCHLWGPGIQTDAAEAPAMPPDMPAGHVARRIPVTPFVPGSGLTTLGVPADAPGGSSHSQGKWCGVIDQATEMLTKLRTLPDTQLQHALLRYCLDGCKVMHLLRTTDCCKNEEQVARMSDLVRRATSDLVGIDLPPLAYSQATLPIAFGGLGIKDPQVVVYQARISALTAFDIAARVAVGVPDEAVMTPAPDLSKVLEQLAVQMGPNAEPVQLWLREPNRMASSDPKHAKQQWWSHEAAAVRRSRLLETGPVRDRARLACQEGPTATGWLQVVPCAATKTTFSTMEYCSLL